MAPATTLDARVERFIEFVSGFGGSFMAHPRHVDVTWVEAVIKLKDGPWP